MTTLTLELTLKEPLVLSQSNATSGAHQSLDYLHGSTILGALAAKNYVDFKNQKLAIEVFHSGQVRFLNAYPKVGAQASCPMPICLHYDKLGNKEHSRNYIQQPYNTENDGKVIQGKQHRSGFITQDKEWLHPEKSLQMRTAIDPEKGSAADGQLYGYQMLKAGSTYVSQIECDNEQTADVILQRLSKQKHLFIGRSRTAQFGRVDLNVAKSSLNTALYAPVLSIKNQDYLILWLQSDLAIYDQYGQPNLSPNLSDLGLKSSGQLDSNRSFIRTRQFAPYNAHRKSYDLERQVLQQGSVLSFKLSEPFNPQDLETLQKGLGCHTESGLGQIVLNDHFKLLEKTDIEFNQKTQSTEPNPINAPQSTLIKFLTAKAEQQDSAQKSFVKIEDAINELKDLYRAARRYNNIDENQAYGPSKTQWGAIRDQAENGDSQTLNTTLLDGTHALIKESDADWSIYTGNKTFRDWLTQQINENSTDYIRDLCAQISRNKDLINVMEGK